MNWLSMAYRPGTSLVHRLDARFKIAFLFAYSIALLAVPVPAIAFALCVLPVAAVLASGVSLWDFNRALVPVYVLAAFSLAVNVASNFSMAGLLAGLLVALRMVALVAASLVVCFTTTSTDLLDAFRRIIAPLRHLRVPVDDVACTLSLALYFIPVIGLEFEQIRAAQVARGAGRPATFTRRLSNWGVAFTALFVGLFRHADAVASAMDARCYGLKPRDPKWEVRS